MKFNYKVKWLFENGEWQKYNLRFDLWEPVVTIELLKERVKSSLREIWTCENKAMWDNIFSIRDWQDSDD